MKREFSITISARVFIVISIIWSYFFTQMALPCSIWWLYGGAALYLVATIFLYRKVCQPIVVTGFDLVVLGGICLFNLLLHWSNLFTHLGGDELYHAERSQFILQKARSYTWGLGSLKLAAYRSSIWNLFDLRHIAVVDLWRIIGVGILVVSVGVGCCFQRVWATSVRWRPYVVSLLLVVLAVAGSVLSIGPENHPPMRTFPLFVSQLFLGVTNFAFRVPGVLMISFVSFVFYQFLVLSFRSQATWWSILLALSIGFVPTIFYSMELAEPSIWGFATYALSILFVIRYFESKNFNLLIFAGVVVGIGSLFRQSTVVVWALVLAAFLLSDYRFNLRRAVKVFWPGLLVLPYLVNVKTLGHTAVKGGEPLTALTNSITGGIGPMAILNTTTIPWVVTGLLAFLYLLSKKDRRLWILLLFVPAYVIFHTIWEYLWGMGRYQAEYVAPFIVLLLFLLGQQNSRRLQVCFSSLLVFCSLVTVELYSNQLLDVNYARWPQGRLTTALRFPYGDALRHLKREEKLDKFVFLGGSPWYGGVSIWLNGGSFIDEKRWSRRQNEFGEYMKKARTPRQVAAFLRSKGVKALVVQTGTRIERQHRKAHINQTIGQLEEPRACRKEIPCRAHRFIGPYGGVLDLYLL